jgi:hypothetical protein
MRSSCLNGRHRKPTSGSISSHTGRFMSAVDWIDRPNSFVSFRWYRGPPLNKSMRALLVCTCSSFVLRTASGFAVEPSFFPSRDSPIQNSRRATMVDSGRRVGHRCRSWQDDRQRTADGSTEARRVEGGTADDFRSAKLSHRRSPKHVYGEPLDAAGRWGGGGGGFYVTLELLAVLVGR